MQLTAAFGLFSGRLDPAGRAPLAVAFSGGGDSLALLVAARAWARTCGRTVMALHVDHRLQPQSQAWADMAEAAARGLGAGFRRLVWSGPKPVSGLPAAARAARLRLLAGAVRELDGCVLLLGHTADDVAEGEWMRREGGSLGRLRVWGPSPVWPEGRDVFHFRPLLHSRRAALRAELRTRGLHWLDDPANEDLRFARARARQALQGRTDGADGEGELASCTISAQADRWGAITLDRAQLCGAPEIDGRRTLALAATCSSGGETPPRSDRLDRLLQRLRTGHPLVSTLGGAKLVADDRAVVFGRDDGRLDTSAGAELPVATGRVWDGRFLVTAEAPGWRVAALRGRAARLPAGERQALKRVPAALRPALPAAIKDGETLTCPILAHGPVMAVSLAGRRSLAAMGAMQTESQAMAPAHGEPGAGDLSLASMFTKAET